MSKIAVIQRGGKQYVVSQDGVVTIEKLLGTEKVGEQVTFDSVLLSDNGKSVQIGTPTISDAKVMGEITQIGRSRKIMVLCYRTKSRYKKTKGHRQPFLKVKITSL